MSPLLRTLGVRNAVNGMSINTEKRYLDGRIDHSICVCIKMLTYCLGCIIGYSMTTPAKRKALLASGTLNPHPEAVRSPWFEMEFFDPYDFAQVKYEMLRAHSVDEDPVAEVCRQFGLSRESFYQIQQAFRELRFASLLPRMEGRRKR